MRSHARASSAGSGTRRIEGLVAFFAIVCALGLLAAPAGAELPTHPQLPALGQTGFTRVCGLAVDSEGNRYVSEFANKEVKVYSPSGAEITHFSTSPANTFNPCGLAVDSQGDVYVNGRNKDVVKYKPSSFPPVSTPTPTTYEPDTSVNTSGVLVAEGARGVAVDPATDNVYVAFEGHISSYEPDGTPISETIGEGISGGGFVAVAVRGSTGKIYAYSSPKAYVLSPDGSEVLAEINGSTTQAGSFNGAFLGLAVDQSNGHFYLADIGSEAEGHKVVDEFDSGGELVSEIHNPGIVKDANPTGIAVDNSGTANDGDLFFSAGQSPSSVFAYGALAYAKFFDLEVKKAGPGHGTVTSDPAGINCGSSCKVGFEKGAEVTLTPSPAAGYSFGGWQGCSSVVGVECKVTMSKKRKVTAKFNAKPAIKREHVHPGVTSALLEATINPNGEATSYQFEYLSEDAYQANGESFSGPEEATKIPDSPEGIGNGYEGVAVSAGIEGLTEHSAYRFRVVTTNSLGTDEGDDFPFITYLPPDVFEPCPNDAYRTGVGANLPDCRAYEQATPTAKNGGELSGDERYVRASDDGTRISFLAYAPVPGGEGASSFNPPYLASRGPSGWSTQGLLPPQSLGLEALLSNWTPDFRHVFEWGRLLGDPKTTGLFDRDTATGSVTTLVPHRAEFSEPVVQGMSEDGSVAVFEYEAINGLDPGAVQGRPNLYAWSRSTGAVRLEGVLNDGKAPAGGAMAGPAVFTPLGFAEGVSPIGAYTRDQHALSADGRILYFTSGTTQQLYLRLNPAEPQSPLNGQGECTDPALACTYQVSASQRSVKGPDPAGSQHARFQVASADGSAAFFTSSELLTEDANTGPEQEAAQIGRAKVSGSEAEGTKLDFLLTHAVDVATSPDGEYIYWTDPANSAIGRAKLPEHENEPPPEFNPAFIEVGPTEFETRPKTEPGVKQKVPSRPRYLAVNSEYVYWTNTGPVDTLNEIKNGLRPIEGAGTIGRAKLGPSGPEPAESELITGASDPTGIALDGEHVYWANTPESSKERGIGRATLEGEGADTKYCDSETLLAPLGLSEEILGIAISGEDLYLSVRQNSGVVGRIVKDKISSCEALGSLYPGGPETPAVAVDGSHVFWAANKEGNAKIGRIDAAALEGFKNCNETPGCDDEFIHVGGKLGGLALAGEHLYWGSNGEGSPNPGSDLYRYDSTSGTLSDLTPDDAEDHGADVQGVLGASQNGSYVYFVANGVLADGVDPGNCPKGYCNLYVYHEGQIRFIARLNTNGDVGGADEDNWSLAAERSQTSGQNKTSRISADGRTLLFTSAEKLTDYDNEGVRELYRYRFGEPGVICVSCNPTGLPPSSTPGFSTTGPAGAFSSNSPAGTLTRPLSDDGNRVFFTTTESLVAEDTNESLVVGGPSGSEPCPIVKPGGFACQDVYEWEAKGTGTCESEEQNGGCLYLISTGKSKEPAFFADVSASGDDVFFFTRDRLSSQDKDSFLDVYDAKVGGGLASQNESPPAPPCEGEACTRGATPAPDAGSPATPLFSGPGNEKPRHRKHRARKHKHKHKHHRHAKSKGRAHR